MKRVLILLSATAVMVLMFASAAPAVVHLCSNHPNQQSAQAALNQVDLLRFCGLMET